MPGYFDAFLYALFTAISFTFIDRLDDHINPYLSLFYMTIFATLFFNLINYKSIKHLYASCIKHPVTYLLMAAFIAINWICSILAPNWSDPFIYLAVGFMSQATVGFIFMKKDTIVDIIVHTICIAIFIATIYFTYHDYIIGAHRNMQYGLVLGVIGGTTVYYYAHFSNNLAQKAKFSPTQVLAVRNWLLVIIMLLILKKQHISLILSMDNLGLELGMSAITLMLPIYFLQSSISKVGVVRYSILVAITPVLAFLVYSMSTKSLNTNNLILAIVITFVLVFLKLFAIIKQKHK